MRTAAERYCAELRSKGYEAWFYHDDDSETSIVTVGHFNRSAYDSRSTLMSPEVEDLMRQFPAHMTNGEPVLLPVDRTNPKGRMKAQRRDSLKCRRSERLPAYDPPHGKARCISNCLEGVEDASRACRRAATRCASQAGSP